MLNEGYVGCCGLVGFYRVFRWHVSTVDSENESAHDCRTVLDLSGHYTSFRRTPSRASVSCATLMMISTLEADDGKRIRSFSLLLDLQTRTVTGR
jgi:hypothetical protein